MEDQERKEGEEENVHNTNVIFVNILKIIFHKYFWLLRLVEWGCVRMIYYVGINVANLFTAKPTVAYVVQPKPDFSITDGTIR